MESFLEVCRCIRNLEIDSGQSRLIDLAVLSRHGHTLRSLVLGTALAEINLTYSPASIKPFSDMCHRLKYLAINLPDPDLGSIGSLAANFALNKAPTDLADVPVRKLFSPRV